MKPTKLSFTGYRKYRLNVLQTKASSDPRLDPPCGGCTACCSHYKSINIKAHELGQEWLLADTPDEQGNAHLRHKADGSCIYLGEHGCSIYERTKPNEWRSLCELLQGATPQDWHNLMDNMVKHG